MWRQSRDLKMLDLKTGVMWPRNVGNHQNLEESRKRSHPETGGKLALPTPWFWSNDTNFGFWASKTMRTYISIVGNHQVGNVLQKPRKTNAVSWKKGKREVDDKKIGKCDDNGRKTTMLHSCKINASPSYEIKQSSEGRICGILE